MAIIIQETGHAIKPNHSSALPRYIVSCAVSTITESVSDRTKTRSKTFNFGSLRIGRVRGSACSPGIATESDCSGVLADKILSVTGRKHTVWVVAKGMLEAFMLLDFPALFADKSLELDAPRAPRTPKESTDGKPTFNPLAVFDRLPFIIGARCLATGGRIVFLDIGNWLDLSKAGLEPIGNETAGNAQLESSNGAAVEQITSRECDRLYRIFCDLISFVKANNFGMFRYTAAAQAMSAFRHKYMPRKILVHDNAEVKSLERRSYFGGRFETWRHGTIREPIYHVDVSSMYPSIMREKKLPWILDRSEMLTEYRTDLPPSEPTNTVCECLLQTKEAIFPVRAGGCVLYPTGKFYTTLAGPEYQLALTIGAVIKTRSWAKYRTKVLFDIYVEGLWKLRLQFERENNAVYAAYTKQLLNSLYGKFGQMQPAWDWQPEAIAPGPWKSWRVIDTASKTSKHFRSVGYDVQREIDRKEKPGSFPAISSWITSWGRIKMNELRAIAGAGNVYQQGSDSLLLTEKGYSNLERWGLVSDRTLGMVRLKEIADGVIIRHPADYSINGREVTAGRALAGETDANGVYWQQISIARTQLFSPTNNGEIHEVRCAWNQLGNSGGPRSDDCGWVGAPEMDVSEIS